MGLEHLRIVNAAVVEDKAGAGKGHARFLRLELQLDDMVVPCREVRGKAKALWRVRTESGKGEPTVP